MVNVPQSALPRASRGASMIEVLVTMVIIAFGLLGMAGLQVRMQASEMESYQRSQALLLLNDMANRIATNRTVAGSYITASAIGPDSDCAADFSGASLVAVDKREWCEALKGAGETSGATKTGAMIGGRGCVELSGGDYLITVAWQGLTPIAAPPTSVTCGAGTYNAASGSCVMDLCRRVVTTLVRVATL